MLQIQIGRCHHRTDVLKWLTKMKLGELYVTEYHERVGWETAVVPDFPICEIIYSKPLVSSRPSGFFVF